jgi:hypothetical protein
MGPGTNVLQNVDLGITPKNYNDALALKHDFDYLTNKEPILTDLTAIIDSDWTLSGLAMKAGLGLRSIADAAFHIPPLSLLINNPTHINTTVDCETYERHRRKGNKLLSGYDTIQINPHH